MFSNEDKAKILLQVRKEYEVGIEYKQGRVKAWHNIEDQYFNVVKKVLKGRFNIPFPVMSGFVETLLSKVDEATILKFSHNVEANLRAAQKVQAFYKTESANEDADWDSKEIDTKKLAIMSGRGINKYFAESDPKYCSYLYVTDHYDFFCSPTGGGDLEDHRYCGEDNIFKDNNELIEGAKSGLYDKFAVNQLVNFYSPQSQTDNNNKAQNKLNRIQALNLSSVQFNYVGEGMKRFIEQGTTYNGQRVYVLWNYEMNLMVRCQPLKEVFESGLWPWTSWATNRDKFNFWSKGPCDDIYPVAESIKIFANQELDNRQKKNYGQRMYDPAYIENPAELAYRPDGLVATKSGASKIRRLADMVYTFETPELNGTINLINWLDDFVGRKSSITADTQGQATTSKVGIYQGNLQQVADRLGLYNKSYARAQVAIGRRFLWGLKEHCNRKQAVQIIGADGASWDTLIGSEVDPALKISVEGGNAQKQIDQLKKENRSAATAAIVSNPLLLQRVNKDWILDKMLANGDFSDEEIRLALDADNYGNREILAQAAEAIEMIVEGKVPKLNQGANTAFQQKIIDFAQNNSDLPMKIFRELIAYSEAHNDIVLVNTNRKIRKQIATMGAPTPTPAPTQNMPMNAPNNYQPA